MIALLIPLLLLLAPGSAAAFPTDGPASFCATYPSVPACRGGTVSCLTCHTAPPVLNPFGAQVRSALEPGRRADGFAAALAAVEGFDADNDGAPNLEELLLGTSPADPLSTPRSTGPEGPAYGPIGQYDAEFAFRRIKIAFCGVGPSYEDVQALRRSTDQRGVLHDTLTACLESGYWRREAIPRIADARIRPLVALGTCQNMLADFEHDYRLFTYAMTGGHDARDLVVGDYHVARDASGDLVRIDESAEPLMPPESRGGIPCRDPFGNSPPLGGGQPLAAHERAGMMTTQWFLLIQTQATYLPRTTAAAAYRAWLGFDIANYEGLFPVPGEPRDIDEIGIDQTPCYQCHSTLDPLAYSFAYYNGISTGRGPPGAAQGPATGAYDPERPTTFFLGPVVAKEAWADAPPMAYALGKPMPAEASLQDSTSLVRMARGFASSSAFSSHVAGLVWAIAIGHPVGPGQHAEFAEVERAFRGSNYSVDELAHAIIDTHAFGAL